MGNKKAKVIDPLEVSMDDFFDKYKPIKNTLVEGSSYDNCMFETYGKELEEVKKHPNKNIWTVVDAGGIHLDIIAGFRLVNRIGYLVTENPWENENQFVHD